MCTYVNLASYIHISRGDDDILPDCYAAAQSSCGAVVAWLGFRSRGHQVLSMRFAGFGVRCREMELPGVLPPKYHRTPFVRRIHVCHSCEARLGEGGLGVGLRRPTRGIARDGSNTKSACPGVVYRAYDCSGSLGHVAVKAPERKLSRIVMCSGLVSIPATSAWQVLKHPQRARRLDS